MWLGSSSVFISMRLSANSFLPKSLIEAREQKRGLWQRPDVIEPCVWRKMSKKQDKTFSMADVAAAKLTVVGEGLLAAVVDKFKMLKVFGVLSELIIRTYKWNPVCCSLCYNQSVYWV